MMLKPRLYGLCLAPRLCLIDSLRGRFEFSVILPLHVM